MNKLASIFLLLFAPQLAQCFPVTSGGNTSLQVFFCSNPECASKVTKVFCNDKPLFIYTPLPDCTDLPPPNSVCQHEGQAFVSTDSPGSCDFEGDNYIMTEKCKDQTDVCDFTSATTSLLLTTKSVQEPQKNPIICYCVTAGAGIALVLLVPVAIYFYKKRQNRENNQQSTRNESEPLRESNTPEKSVDTQDDQGRLDNGHSLSLSQSDPVT